ncbi:hypothetical protein M2459_002690 [Parabacteroides sp. PF5-5]|uniref:porin family protein n=1 Tax=unclassified Parabacteroides TaxID=2649774 RepID=UPI00247715D1|nr:MULTISPECIES: porin family protein [unclassified Parabacteroides]MDH6306327.1 hypothetical protein [Parabacteroides sp. PH5-39]MDH6316882.1 hypothetical protein [Parabacteroides sp. PF5-13]MDH6320951.1 hypothetical protein [Parabacteroides sp. PH5-13]MDH6324683.1 hypothetical protein [Parabacteroides sp. PH5-8]MDH6328067.1 hypothetical protein [Parabacteroides sp. PH5-41]
MKTGFRKYVLLGLIMVWAIPAVTAQVTFGVKAGLARSSMIQKIDLDHESGSQLGFSVAGLADIPFYRRFSFRPEIAFTKQGGHFFSDYNEDKLPGLKHTCNYYSLQTPLNIAFNIPISGVRMAVYGGLVPDFRLWGKMKTLAINGESRPQTEKNMKSFDLGCNAGISVEYKKVFFAIDIYNGILDCRVDKKESESRVYHNNISFSLGYFFR